MYWTMDVHRYTIPGSVHCPTYRYRALTDFFRCCQDIGARSGKLNDEEEVRGKQSGWVLKGEEYCESVWTPALLTF